MNAVRQVAPAAHDELSAILNRWSRHAITAPVCNCKECRNARALPFTCTVCGYSGTPWVWACECSERFAQHIASEREALRKARSAKYCLDSFGRDITKREAVARHQDMIARLEAKLAEGRHRHGDEWCDSCHGHRECPVCIGPDREEVQAGYAIVRDIRAALNAAGLL